MQLTSLHHYLHELSPNELRYKAGHCFQGWERLEKTIVNGRTCYVLSTNSFAENHMELKEAGTSYHTSPIISTTLPNLCIKRNSRFNPVPEHIHTHIELNYVYSGCCPQIVDGRPIVLKKNQVLLIDTNCPHSIASLGEDDIMITLILYKDFLKEHIFSQFSKDSILSHFFINAINEKTDHDHFLLFHSEKSRRIPLFFRELFCECYDPSVNSSDIIMHLFYTIMAELINVYENDLAKEERFGESISIVPMIRYIERNFRTCSQESVADFFHISPNYVSVLLKKYTGMTYIQMIQTHKLKYAVNLLKSTDLPVAEIAHRAGYENISFFYKKFQKKYHCSPAEYRVRHLRSFS